MPVPAPNPTCEAKRGIEVRLDSLLPGSQFKSNPMTFGGFTYQGQSGTLLYVTQSRARVRVRITQADRKFKTAKGDEVTFAGQNYKETDWAPDSPVEFVGMDSNFKSSGTSPNHNNNHKETIMTTETAEVEATQAPSGSSEARAKSILLKWKFNLSALQKALAVDGSTAATNTFREKLQAVYEEAIEAEVSLDPPEFDDSAFADMVFDKPREKKGDKAVTAKAASVPASVRDKEAVAARQKAKKAATGTGKARQAKGNAKTAQDGASGKKAKASKVVQMPSKKAAKTPKAPKAAKSASATPKAPRPKKAKALSPCHDGCGDRVTGRFRQGHDARYKSLILQVEREELAEDKLPAYMRKSGGIDDQPLVFKKVGNGYRCTNPIAKIKH